MLDLNVEKIPATVYEAVDILYEGLTDEERDYILSHDKWSLHHGVGTCMRNGWKLWHRETPLVQWCIKELQVGHGDDISGLMFTGLWQKVHGQPVDFTEQIAIYHKHWRGMGVDPITQERLVA